jgi:hypothetical protein
MHLTATLLTAGMAAVAQQAQTTTSGESMQGMSDQKMTLAYFPLTAGTALVVCSPLMR